MPLPAAAMRRGICKQNETEKEKKEFVYERICVIGGDLKRKSANSKKKKKRKKRRRSQADFGRANAAASSKELSVCVCVSFLCG